MLLVLLLLFCPQSLGAPTRAKDSLLAGFNTHRLEADMAANVAGALEMLRNCETGRKALAEAGLPVDREITSLKDLQDRNIGFVFADLKNDHALTRLQFLKLLKRAVQAVARGSPPQGEGDDPLVIILRRPITRVSPRVIAPILAHELSHVKDYRRSEYSLEMMAASERHGWMAQTHVVMELAEQGFLPGAPDSHDEAALAAAQWTLVDIWNGIPLMPPDRYGETNARQVQEFNRHIASHPGLPALVAYGDLMTRLGFNVGPWLLDRSHPSPAAKAMDDAILKEDRRFSEIRRKSRPVARPSSPPSAPPSPTPEDSLPLVAEPPPKPLEVAVPPHPMEVAVPPQPPSETAAPPSPQPGPTRAEPQPPDDSSFQKPDNADLDPARKAIKKAEKAKIR